jgi:LemA protein
VKALKYTFSIFIALFAMIYLEQCSSKPKTADKDSLDYKALTKSELVVKKAWGDVETQYQRRTDLYSSVIIIIESSAKVEKYDIKEVLDARASATQFKVNINDPASLEKYQAAQGQLQSSFGKLMGIAEGDPALKSTKAFQDFQMQIEGTENRLNISRHDYNSAVTDFNIRLKKTLKSSKDDFSEFKEKSFLEADVASQGSRSIFLNK